MLVNTRRHGNLVARALSKSATSGWLEISGRRFACAFGRAGLGHIKREGDGKTPIGQWPVVEVLWRGDRQGRRYFGGLPCRPVIRSDGWCDATGDANYNRSITHPYPASAERLWRDDHLYDVIVVLGHNRCPRVQGLGSAIFMHVARENRDGGLRPTEGCVALRQHELDIVLGHLRPGCFLSISA